MEQAMQTTWKPNTQGLQVKPVIKRKSPDVVKVEQFTDAFRRRHLQRFANYLDQAVKHSGVVANQSQIEDVTAKLGKRFAISRQYVSWLLKHKNGTASLLNASIISPERVAGIAVALGLPIEQAMEAAGYRTDGQPSQPTNEMSILFGRMSDQQQTLALSVAEAILQVPQEEAPILTDAEHGLLEWYSGLDDSARRALQLAIQSQSRTPQQESPPPPKPEPVVETQVKTVKPVEVLNLNQLESVMPTLPQAAQDRIRAVLVEAGVKVPETNGTKATHNESQSLQSV